MLGDGFSYAVTQTTPLSLFPSYTSTPTSGSLQPSEDAFIHSFFFRVTFFEEKTRERKKGVFYLLGLNANGAVGGRTGQRATQR